MPVLACNVEGHSVGKLAPPTGYSEPIFRNLALIWVEADLEQPSFPESKPRDERDPAKRKAAWDEWRATEAGKAWTRAYDAYQEERERYPIITATVDRDGSFRIDDMPAGKYALRVRFNKNPPGVLQGYRFVVPTTEKNAPTEPMGLGILTMTEK